MKPFLSRIASACGMFLPLLLLCAFFSVATLNDQFPTGDVAARQVAAEIERSLPRPAHVVIAARNQPDDLEFANRLEANLTAAGARVLAVIRGEPKDAALALRKIGDAGEYVDAIACTQETSEWLVFSEMKTDFPALGDPRILRPQPYRWPDFLKPTNLLNIADQIAIIAIIAIGMTMVILTGGIDLSVGSLIALSSVLASMFIRDFAGGRDADPLTVTLACIVAVLLCGLVGTFTGCLIALFDVQPFIVTLSMLLVGSGLAGILSKSQSISEVPLSFTWLGRGADLFGVPNAVVLMMVLYLAAHVLLSRMRLGRYIYAVGGNAEAARLSGVPVGRILIFVYTVSALLAGVGGVLMTSQLRSGSSTYGQWYELYAITAVVVGGTSLSGGEGTIGGTLIGAFTIAVFANGMNLFNVNSKVQLVVLGPVILSAVLLDKLRHRSELPIDIPGRDASASLILGLFPRAEVQAIMRFNVLYRGPLIQAATHGCAYCPLRESGTRRTPSSKAIALPWPASSPGSRANRPAGSACCSRPGARRSFGTGIGERSGSSRISTMWTGPRSRRISRAGSTGSQAAGSIASRYGPRSIRPRSLGRRSSARSDTSSTEACV